LNIAGSGISLRSGLYFLLSEDILLLGLFLLFLTVLLLGLLLTLRLGFTTLRSGLSLLSALIHFRGSYDFFGCLLLLFPFNISVSRKLFLGLLLVLL
jgi:hypothetical protein